MARQRKTDPEAALQAAMVLFWEHGYGDLGTRQIEEETGITRFTLQTSYGGKMSLFLEALDAYLDAVEIHISPNMTDGELETIAAWFEMRVAPPVFADVTRYGCFMLNSSVEFFGENSFVNARTERFYKMFRGGLYKALVAVKAKGGVAPDFDEEAMAEMLYGAAIGVNVVIRAAGANEAGGPMAKAVAQLVRSWSQDTAR